MGEWENGRMGEWENGEMLDSVAVSQCGGETVKKLNQMEANAHK
jgi:hypothetical protein